MPIARLAYAAILALPLLGPGSSAASAQQAPAAGVGASGFSPPVHGEGAALPRRAKEPPGLPGTAAKPGETADKVHTDLPPTEALFDAVNRGDVTEARDAVNRGAEVGAENALGLTPLDLSIDLSRNDITFLLLSVRGQDNPSRPQGGKLADSTAKAANPPARLATLRVPRPPMVKAALSTRHQPSPAQQFPRYAGEGGAPNPQAGFLGFGRP